MLENTSAKMDLLTQQLGSPCVVSQASAHSADENKFLSPGNPAELHQPWKRGAGISSISHRIANRAPKQIGILPLVTLRQLAAGLSGETWSVKATLEV